MFEAFVLNEFGERNCFSIKFENGFLSIPPNGAPKQTRYQNEATLFSCEDAARYHADRLGIKFYELIVRDWPPPKTDHRTSKYWSS